MRPPGRADGPPEQVVVLATLGAPERRRLAGRRRRATQQPGDPPPAAVTTTRATVVEAGSPLAGEEAARRHEQAATEAEAGAAVRTLNRILTAQRVAVRDPYLREVSLAQAIAIRVGYARGEDAAAGRMAAAHELPAAAGPGPTRRRVSALRPQEHLAAALGGRVAILAGEELALRARADLDAGRERLAALELRAAVEATVVELAREGSEEMAAPRLDELRALLPATRAAARTARAGKAPAPEELERLLGRLEAALRARAMRLA